MTDVNDLFNVKICPDTEGQWEGLLEDEKVHVKPEEMVMMIMFLKNRGLGSLRIFNTFP